MRHFYSYGPVSCANHFCVERRTLVEHCTNQIIGDLKSGGFYFTIWGPRQSGKTWLMKQVRKEIRNRYGGRFAIGTISMQGIIMDETEADDTFLKKIPKLMLDGFGMDVDPPGSWEEWSLFFHKNKGLFKRPVIVFIDEFDGLPAKIIDRLATLFRDMHLNQGSYLLQGLGLIGVRTALGVESGCGLPFNMQKSLHVPNLNFDEVRELFHQYQEETGQKVTPEVVVSLFNVTQGHPGLVSWFGELLSEKYHPGPDKTIDLDIWKRAYRRACNVEWNNTILSLIKKARTQYEAQVLEIFARSDIPFLLDRGWCNYLYLNGLIRSAVSMDDGGEESEVCRFSCPFVQKRLYKALTYDLVGNFHPILPLNPFDEIQDMFESDKLELNTILTRYKDFLSRLRAKGFTPWRQQFRSSDLRLREAAGYFHLYAWLQTVLSKQCVISPEFPTGSGKADLHLKCRDKRGIIEIRIFTNASEFKASVHRAANYAVQAGLDTITIALFVPAEDEDVLSKLSGSKTIHGVRVTVVAIEWIWQTN
ncbi:MAG: hypothetical protein B6245_06440 [Desulfobacteraceae bacterium 4572_88]|nr:MAG: hypothetical protein B6245_06440 [Desulfobacteraceae bacterium 4572_88]